MVMTYEHCGRPSAPSSGDRTSWIAQSSTYDADRRLDRLQGATPAAGANTLCLDDHEVTGNPDGGTVKATSQGAYAGDKLKVNQLNEMASAEHRSTRAAGQ